MAFPRDLGAFFLVGHAKTQVPGLFVIPSLKLTVRTSKMDGWKMTFPSGARPIFRGKLLVSG